MESSVKDKNKNFRFKERFKKFFKSKIVVIAALVMLVATCFVGTSKANADDNYDLSMVYQYFLLDNQNGYTPPKGKGWDKIAKDIVGVFGSGGNQGQFSYSDIVNGAGKSNKAAAEKFSGIMATLSGYNYIHTSNMGMAWIGNAIQHVLLGLILFVFGLIVDVAQNLYGFIVNVIAQFNVFTMLGNAFGNSSAGNKLGQALGISTADIQQIASIALGCAVVVLVASVVWTLRRGATEIDRGALSKTKARAIGIIGMPAVVVFCSMLLQDVTAGPLSSGNPQKNPVFADYIIPVKTWAEQDNFDMSVGGASGISGSNKDGTYLDSSYNPYESNNKGAKIGQALFQQTSIEGSAFPNTCLAMEYMNPMNTFNARTYLAYIENTSGFNGIQHFVSQFKRSDLYDFSHPRSSEGTDEKDAWKGQNAPMDKAKADYIDDDQDSGKAYLQNENTTWLNRYIYGSKMGGNVKDYYQTKPSLEQIYSGAGGNRNGSTLCFSDESMYLILNTAFNVDGGTFSMNTPASGVYGEIAKFAESSPIWDSVSMVGTPIFTIPKMLTGPLCTLLVVLAMLTAFFEMGIVETNLLPLRAWLKGIFMGDIEFCEAAIIYALGIAGVVAILEIIPGLLTNGLQFILSAIFTPLTQGMTVNNNGTPTVAGTELIGLSGVLSFVVASFAIVLFAKVKRFRDGFIGLMTFPWDWAREKGQKLEDAAGLSGNGDGAGAIMQRARERRDKRNDKHNKKLEEFATGSSRVGNRLNHLTGGLSSEMARTALKAKGSYGMYHGKLDDGSLSPHESLKRELEQAKIASELGNDMQGMKPKAIDQKLEQLVAHGANEALAEGSGEAPLAPIETDEDGMLPVDDPRLTPEEQAEAEDINAEQQALDEEQAQIDADRAELERKHDNGEISDEEYQKELDKLNKRQAEHDRKQGDLDQRRNAFLDSVNGTASLDKDGKFDLDNPNFTPEQREEAKEINNEQDEIDHEQSEIDHEKEQLAQDLQDGKIDQDEYDKGMEELDQRQEELDEKQSALNARKENLQQQVAQNNGGKGATVADLQSQANVAKQLAEQARGDIKAYQERPTPQTAAKVIKTLNAMEQQAQAMGTTSKELYGFDAKKRAEEIQNSKFMPKQMNSNAIRVEDNGDGTQTVITNGTGTNAEPNGQFSRISSKNNSFHGKTTTTQGATVGQLRGKKPTLSGNDVYSGLSGKNKSTATRTANTDAQTRTSLYSNGSPQASNTRFKQSVQHRAVKPQRTNLRSEMSAPRTNNTGSTVSSLKRPTNPSYKTSQTTNKSWLDKNNKTSRYGLGSNPNMDLNRRGGNEKGNFKK